MEAAVRPRHLAISLAAVTLAAAPVAGCGGSSGSDSAQGATKPSSSSQQSAQPGSSAVTIDSFKFMPASLTVTGGTRITVGNQDVTAHTATADNGRSFDTGHIDPKSSATITLSRPGTYQYHCSIHPFMHGTLVVK
jgi:plastocyanin